MSDHDIAFIDLRFQGLAEQACAGLVPTRTGFILVDCGPASTLENLLGGLAGRGLDLSKLHAILLTHIHLDHAGAAGAIAAMAPTARIYVHGEKGAPHLIAPEKLLNSVRRLYGDAFENLLGEMRPIPAAQVKPLSGGETLTIDGRAIEVIPTPGHAWHHLAYADSETRIVFTGDCAGLREPGAPDVVPYTPPPDIDLEAMHASIERLRAARPSALLLSHFGFVHQPLEHLDIFQRGLVEWSEIARPLASGPLDLQQAGEQFKRLVCPGGKHQFQATTDLAHCGQGLVRYWRKKLQPA